MEFAMNDGETLVVVTADHETGWLTVRGGDVGGTGVQVNWSTGGHTNSPVPLFALGPREPVSVSLQDGRPRRPAVLVGSAQPMEVFTGLRRYSLSPGQPLPPFSMPSP